MLNGPGPFSFLRPRREVQVAPPGLTVVPAESRHFRRARQIVAADPVMNVHVGAMLPPAAADAGAGLAHWALLDGPRTIGVVQQYRGVCWALDAERRADARLTAALASVLARCTRFSEIVFGPEAEVRAVIEACRARGVDLLELRRQEMMACRVPKVGALAGQRPGGRPGHDVEALPESGPDGFTLRAAARRDLRWLLVAHGAMCREDLGVDQVAKNPEGYSRYFQDLIRRRRMFVGEVGGRPVFKAEIAQESREASLVEGVYTEPGARGRGYATVAMAWLADLSRTRGRVACLYVHRRNTGAIRVYERVGFEIVSPWATAIVTRDGRRSVRAVEY